MDEGAHEVKLGLELTLGSTRHELKRADSKKNKRANFTDLSIPLHESDHDGYSSSSYFEFKRGDAKQDVKNGFFVGRMDRVGDDHDHDHDHDGKYSKNVSHRKKLRLTKDQTFLLEHNFEQHSTLTMTQKQALAEKLNLKPRQVEVWFQNRRARTKLKQTEIDCEFLKKNYERLIEENRNLKKQVLDLCATGKIEKPPPPPATAAAPPPPSQPLFYGRVAPKVAAVYQTCPSCEKSWKSRDAGGGGKLETAGVGGVVEVINNLH